jgi:hypothetical protein
MVFQNLPFSWLFAFKRFVIRIRKDPEEWITSAIKFADGTAAKLPFFGMPLQVDLGIIALYWRVKRKS